MFQYLRNLLCPSDSMIDSLIALNLPKQRFAEVDWGIVAREGEARWREIKAAQDRLRPPTGLRVIPFEREVESGD